MCCAWFCSTASSALTLKSHVSVLRQMDVGYPVVHTLEISGLKRTLQSRDIESDNETNLDRSELQIERVIFTGLSFTVKTGEVLFIR